MFIYLHGFNSSGQSSKGQYFRTCFAPVPVLTPTYPADPDSAIASLSSFIRDAVEQSPVTSPCTLIGSSLGGYYAQYLARLFRLAVVLINPALQPALTLRPYLGWQTNYYSGERYYFGEKELNKLLNYDIPQPCQQPVPTLVLLDEGDEIIDYRVAQETYSACATVIAYPDGNHQFCHLSEAGQQICAFVHNIPL